MRFRCKCDCICTLYIICSDSVYICFSMFLFVWPIGTQYFFLWSKKTELMAKLLLLTLCNHCFCFCSHNYLLNFFQLLNFIIICICASQKRCFCIAAASCSSLLFFLFLLIFFVLFVCMHFVHQYRYSSVHYCYYCFFISCLKRIHFLEEIQMRWLQNVQCWEYLQIEEEDKWFFNELSLGWIAKYKGGYHHDKQCHIE